MIRLNHPSFLCVFFYISLLLSFFRTDFEDLRILLISEAIVALSFLALGLKVFYKKREKLPINIIIILIVLWILNVSLPIIFNMVQPTAKYGLFQCCAWVFAFFITVSCRDVTTNWRWFKKFACILGSLFSFWAIIQHYICHHMATGPFATRNSNAAFLMLTALIICAEFLNSKKNL